MNIRGRKGVRCEGGVVKFPVLEAKPTKTPKHRSQRCCFLVKSLKAISSCITIENILIVEFFMLVFTHTPKNCFPSSHSTQHKNEKLCLIVSIMNTDSIKDKIRHDLSTLSNAASSNYVEDVLKEIESLIRREEKLNVESCKKLITHIISIGAVSTLLINS